MVQQNLNQHFPATRPRRMRAMQFTRSLMQENILSVQDLIYPIFIVEGTKQKQQIDSMPDIYRLSIDLLIEELQQVADLGIPMVALFPKIEKDKKSLDAKESFSPDGLMQRAITMVKEKIPNLGIMSDIALDPYTIHGQDGIIDKQKYILNDATNAILVKQALSHSIAGADVVAPSDMMDGRIGLIRSALEKKGFHNTLIMSYAAKYASNLYSPFRDAIGSAQNLGKSDKRTYQMDISNSNEAMREIALDIQEGADMIMVKPGLPYLDIVYQAKQTFKMPTFAYHVSGEYCMLKAAVQNGWIDEEHTVLECLTSFKRAGADGVLTYYAKQVAQWLQK